jgi:hypothetical protein
MPKFLHSVVVQALFVFVCSALLATFFLSWDGFVDPDAFYHAKISQIIWENGPIQDFRWLDLTELATHPADLHLAFHLFVAPFTAVFGMFDGLRIASVLLAAACLTTFFLILRWLKLPSPILWTAFLATSPPLLLRLLLGKASPLAILLFLFGIAAAYLRKPWLVALATLAFALSHGGWIYLAGSVVLLAFGDVLFTWIVDGKSIREAVQKTLWKESIAGFAGAFIGLLIHPNFPQNILLSYTQVVRIGLGTPFQHVMLGNEWRPTDPGVLLSNYAPWIILMLLGFMGMAFAARLPLDKFRARLLVSLGWIFAVLLALTFKSRRNTEYLAPIVALWVAVLWSLVDIPRFRTQLAGMFVGRWKRVSGVMIPLIVCCLVAVTMNGLWGTWESLHEEKYADEVYADSMNAISERADAGDRVFHTSWDEFPMLFAQNDDLKYIVGLDPTFLYVASSTLSDAVRDTTWGVTSTTKEAIWSVVHDQTGSRFVFISLPRHQPFYEIIRLDERYIPLFFSSSSAAFEVRSTD